MFQSYSTEIRAFLIKTGGARKTTLKVKDVENQSIQDLQTCRHAADCTLLPLQCDQTHIGFIYRLYEGLYG